mmetsp:Transcript_39175/g.94723  ORF Transcript_39175/g.94723 Transcript_39175/m.94723 type:complete len:341 (-) Transcript_39175:80-1102(-)
MVSNLFLVVVVTTAAVVVSVGTVQGYVPSTTTSRTTFSTYTSSSSSSYHHRIQYIHPNQQLTSNKNNKQWNLYSSQWDDEEETSSVKSSTSFEDAGKSIQDEDDEKSVAGMGDYDSNPAYSDDETARLRAAIRERTESMGLKKSVVSEEAQKQMEERAKARIAAARAGESLDDTFGGIDLSQISQEAPRGSNADNLPSMFYEPESEMSKEEMAEADPVSQMSVYDQFIDTVQTATWPSGSRVIKDVAILVTTILLSGLILVGWDGLLRETYTNFGLIPTPEAVTQPTDNLVLPDGWTDNMSEDDLMKFQDDTSSSSSTTTTTSKASKRTSSSSSQGFPDL